MRAYHTSSSPTAVQQHRCNQHTSNLDAGNHAVRPGSNSSSGGSPARIAATTAGSASKQMQPFFFRNGQHRFAPNTVTASRSRPESRVCTCGRSTVPTPLTSNTQCSRRFQVTQPATTTTQPMHPAQKCRRNTRTNAPCSYSSCMLLYPVCSQQCNPVPDALAACETCRQDTPRRAAVVLVAAVGAPTD